jgi:cobalt-zinc-cadmium efflux system outer membrane protein
MCTMSRAVRQRVGGGRVAVLWAAGCLLSASASAQPAPLTLADVIARARLDAPAVVVAALTLEETRGRLVGADRRVASNPDLDGAIGRRDGEDGVQTDLQFGISQMFQPGSRRHARVEGAEAAIAQTRADIEDTRRRTVVAAVEAFYRAVYAEERVRLLQANASLAESVQTVAQRRFEAGDVAVLDVNLARTALARTRADVTAAQADAVTARGELQRILGVASPITVDGSLPAALADDVALDARLLTVATRPDLQAIEAGMREAGAERRSGSSYGRPDYGLGARYSREEGDQIVMGTFTITLPVAGLGKEATVTGAAREARLKAALDAARLQAQIDVTTAHGAYERRRSALQVLERDVVATLDDTLALSTRSFEVGQIGITDVLVMRREVNDARLQYLDTLLSAVLARVALDGASGVLR